MHIDEIAKEIADSLDKMAGLLPEQAINKEASDEEIDSVHTLNFLKFFSIPLPE